MLTAQTLARNTLARIGVLKTDAPATPSYLSFKREFWRGYTHLPYHAYIDRHLEQVATYIRTGGREGIGRLMIFMPPRHGKTQSASKLFPAWMQGQLPDLRMITASYGATLAYRNSRTVRNIIADQRYAAYFPGVKLANDSAAADTWDISGHDGGMIAAGLGGGIAGHGARLIILDDLIKSRAEAESVTYRERAVDWYNNDLLTRLEEPGGAIVIMNTRWHERDLCGYLLSDDSESWTVIRLPALAEENDPLGRKVGEALWPDRYSAAILADRRERMGDYAFSSLYQQRPKPAGGGLFDTSKITIVDTPPTCKQTVRFYDLAVTNKKTSDYTVGVLMGIAEDEKVVILDVWRGQKTPVDVHQIVVQNALIDGKDTRVRLEAEKAGIVQLDYLLRDERMRPFTIDAKPPEGDKYTRAAPFAARVNAGKAIMVRGAWNRAYLDELSLFNQGEHDDQVDASSGAYDMLANDQSVTFEFGSATYWN